MAKPKILEQYAGRLTTDQAAQAIQAALQTARELLEDAHILLQKDRWARAAALSILAIEEAGKVPIVREILLAPNPDDLKIAWRSYRSHTKKNVVHIFPVMAKRGAKKLEDFRTIYHDNVEDVHSLDVVKQLAFYSDCCGKCHWSLPESAVSGDLAKSIFALAKLVLGRGAGSFTTKAELDLWIKHLGPVWKHDMNKMQKALLACYVEAQEKGVLQGKASADDMMRFLYGEGASDAS